jgi:hypothetical protein
VGYFTSSNDFYLPSLRLEEEGGGGAAPCGFTKNFFLVEVSWHWMTKVVHDVILVCVAGRGPAGGGAG